MSNLYVPKALQDVWASKEASYREVAHLPTPKALRAIMHRAEKTARELGFTPVEGSARRRLAVAEEHPEYATKPPRRR